MGLGSLAEDLLLFGGHEFLWGSAVENSVSGGNNVEFLDGGVELEAGEVLLNTTDQVFVAV